MTWHQGSLEIDRLVSAQEAVGGLPSNWAAAPDRAAVEAPALRVPATPQTQGAFGASPAENGGAKSQAKKPLLRRLLAWTLAIPMSIANRERTLDALFGPQAMPYDFAKRGGSLLILRPRAIIAASSDLLAPKDDLDAMQARLQDALARLVAIDPALLRPRPARDAAE